jgi:hypothetical protein
MNEFLKIRCQLSTGVLGTYMFGVFINEKYSIAYQMQTQVRKPKTTYSTTSLM